MPYIKITDELKAAARAHRAREGRECPCPICQMGYERVRRVYTVVPFPTLETLNPATQKKIQPISWKKYGF